MRQSLPSISHYSNSNQHQLEWVLLPGLCCLGAGGKSEQADRVAAAWLLLYVSAHIFDSIEDRDQPDPWMSETGSPIAINVASGLIFSAYRCLGQLFEEKASSAVVTTIVDDFSSSLLLMSSGQHTDLLEAAPRLEQWFRIAEAKSGNFFALSCRAGAHLSIEDSERLKGFSDFGNHLGIALQIYDDIGDFHAYQQGERPVRPDAFFRSLAVAYVNEAGTSEVKRKLQDFIASIREDNSAIDQAIQLLDDVGAGLYLTTELVRQRQRALDALIKARPKKAVGEKLAGLFDLLEA